MNIDFGACQHHPELFDLLQDPQCSTSLAFLCSICPAKDAAMTSMMENILKLPCIYSSIYLIKNSQCFENAI